MIESIYIHIPFCSSKCPYCSFLSFAGMLDKTKIKNYYKGLKREILSKLSLYGDKCDIKTVFLGGGTPSLLGESFITAIIGEIDKSFHLNENVEISVEVNPGTVDFDFFRGLQKSGVNRISLGVQSFQNRELVGLGRRYKKKDIDQVIKWLRQAGLSNYNLDLMTGIPYQTANSWYKTLEKCLENGAEHLSIYELKIEENTPFEIKRRENTLCLPAEDEIEAIDNITDETLERAGFRRYEISNFCKGRNECKHNITYWKNQEYIGIGCGAFEYIEGVRRCNIGNVDDYLCAVKKNGIAVLDSEKLDRKDKIKETMVVGLRLIPGVNKNEINERFGIDIIQFYDGKIEAMIKKQLLIEDGERIRLTRLGLRYANSVMAELV